MQAVDAVLIGAGMRGRYVYGAYARRRPDRLRIVALCEPEPARREALAGELGLAPDRVFADWPALLAQDAIAPVAIVATGDTFHVEPALAAFRAGYHVLLEKPMAPDPVDCVRVVAAAETAGRMLQISHVLRYTPFYNRVHEIVASGRLGRLVAVDMKEHVSHWHMTHSYVRGKFRNRGVAAPIMLAKCCHDLDLLAWLVDRPATRLASFGSLAHFRAERAPAGAPERCSDGCPVQASCPHDAVRLYLAPDERLARLWPWSDVSPDPSREARRRALEAGPYGRCAYRCDNDVVDHQIVAMEFADGATATFTMQGLATHERRTIRLSGTEGELRGVLHDGVIEVTRHGSLEVERQQTESAEMGHFGGDEGLLDHFTDVASRGASAELRASGRSALESHLLGFAAEEARTTGQVVDLTAYRSRIQAAASSGAAAR